MLTYFTSTWDGTLWRTVTVTIAMLSAGQAYAASPIEDAATSTFSSGYENGIVAVSFRDCSTSEVLYQRDGDKSVAPASCLKLLTTGAALHYYKPTHRFITTLEATGEAADEVLHGNLVVRGGGDPTLGSDRVPGAVTSGPLLDRWSAAVRKLGITSIQGEIVADSSFLPYDPVPVAWDWEDMGNYYGAGPFGLCFHDNLYHLDFKPGEAIGDPAQITGTRPQLKIDWLNEVSTGSPSSGDQAYIKGAPRSNFRHVTGTVPQGTSFSIRGSLPEPPATLAEMLAKRLAKDGTELKTRVKYESSEAEPAGERVLDKVESPELIEIIRVIHKQSFNLYAEMALMHIAKAGNGDGRRATGTKRVKDFLVANGVDAEGFHLSDGSGLARNNEVTADGYTAFLTAMRRHPQFAVWHECLSTMGVDGDLRRRQVNSALKGRVKAKTGLIGGARGLCGYLEAKSGRVLAFAIISNRHNKGTSQVDRDIEKVLLVAYENY